jgi:Flp pilus assembly protein TadD
MKKYLVIAGALALTACSSAPAPTSREGQRMNEPEPRMAFDDSKIESKPVPVSRDNAPSQRATRNELDDAINSQNDEKIYSQASTLLLQNPQDPKALNALALYHYKKGRFNAAKYFLGKAIQAKESSELYNNLGVVHLAVNEKKEAILAFRQAMNLNPKGGAAGANLGAILAANRSYSNANVALQAAYDEGYRDARVLNNYAVALTAVGKGEEAQSLYEKALKEQSANKEIMLNYAILLIDHLKKNKEGLDVINRLKFVGPTSGQLARIKELENKAK